MRALLLSLVFLLPLAASAAEDGPINVVQVLDLSGPNGDTGKDFWTGAKVYFDYLNAHGGVNGRKINHVYADDQGVPANTLALTKKLVGENKPAALFGYFGVENVSAVINDRELGPSQLPLIAPYAGGNPVGGAAQLPVYYARPTYVDELQKIAGMTGSIGINRLAVVTGDDSLGRAVGDVAAKTLAAEKSELVVKVSVASNGSNLAAVLRQVESANPQAIILAAPTIASANFVREYQKTRSATQFFSLSWVNHQTLIEMLGPKNARWVAVTTLVPSPYNPTTEIAREFVRNLKQYRDEPPSYSSMEGYIAARVMVEAIKSSRSYSPAAIRQALEATRSLNLGGYALNFDNAARRGSRLVDLAVFSSRGTLLN